jgi:hypothetical protein
MHLRFAPPTTEQLDRLRCEALALPVLTDERPLRGALGIVDWRLCGLVSRLVIRGAVSTSALQTTLVPGRPKLVVDKVFLFGAGPSAELDEAKQRALVEHMLDTAIKAGVRTTALVLPGRGTDLVSPAAAMEILVSVSRARGEVDELIVLEPAEAQKSMEPVLERERRRAAAERE